MKALAQVPANANAAEHSEIASSREFLEWQAFEAFKAFVLAVQTIIRASDAGVSPVLEPRTIHGDPSSDVMTADEASAFLGVDRNTVYDFAGRGVIPHQRLGKRLLFRRGALVAWLDASLCKATSTRKG